MQGKDIGRNSSILNGQPYKYRKSRRVIKCDAVIIFKFSESLKVSTITGFGPLWAKVVHLSLSCVSKDQSPTPISRAYLRCRSLADLRIGGQRQVDITNANSHVANFLNKATLIAISRIQFTYVNRGMTKPSYAALFFDHMVVCLP